MKKMSFLVFSFAMIRAVEMMTGCGDDDEEVEVEVVSEEEKESE